MLQTGVCASESFTTSDFGMRPTQDLCEIVGRFAVAGEGVIAHWVEYSQGVLLFVMAPGDQRSGEFYVYDRKKGRFWLLTLPDPVFGGYPMSDMKRKVREFRLLELAENPGQLARPAARTNSFCHLAEAV